MLATIAVLFSLAEEYRVADEVAQRDLFRLAGEAIDEAEKEGRDVFIPKIDLERAQNCWDKQDYACAKMYLERIVESLAT